MNLGIASFSSLLFVTLYQVYYCVYYCLYQFIITAVPLPAFFSFSDPAGFISGGGEGGHLLPLGLTCPPPPSGIDLILKLINLPPSSFF